MSKNKTTVKSSFSERKKNSFPLDIFNSVQLSSKILCIKILKAKKKETVLLDEWMKNERYLKNGKKFSFERNIFVEKKSLVEVNKFCVYK